MADMARRRIQCSNAISVVMQTRIQQLAGQMLACHTNPMLPAKPCACSPPTSKESTPKRALYARALTKPVSMTKRTPLIVMDVSAMLVAVARARGGAAVCYRGGNVRLVNPMHPCPDIQTPWTCFPLCTQTQHKKQNVRQAWVGTARGSGARVSLPMPLSRPPNIAFLVFIGAGSNT